MSKVWAWAGKIWERWWWLTLAWLLLGLVAYGLREWLPIVWDYLNRPRVRSMTVEDTEILRNLGFALTALLTFIFGFPTILGRMLTSQKQTEINRRNAAANEGALLNARFKDAVDMLANDRMAVRLGGVDALEFLAREHPRECHVRVARQLGATILFPMEMVTSDCPPDSRAAARALGLRRADLAAGKMLVAVEGDDFPDLEGAKLAGARLEGTNFAGANLRGANLEGAVFGGANLREVNFGGARLADANFKGVNLAGAILDGANLSGANVSEASLLGANLTKANLSGVNLSGANLTGANFNGTILAGAELEGALLKDVIGLSQDMLDRAKPTEAPLTLPQGMLWPFDGELAAVSERRRTGD